MDEKRSFKKSEDTHNVIMENRKKLIISGVDDVASFDESTVTLSTTMGMLIIKGSDMKINKLSIDTGDVEVEGELDLLEYTDAESRADGGGFISRLFR